MLDVVIVTGSAGLIGSEATRFFSARGYHVVGIDNDMRAQLFGAEASTAWNRRQLQEQIPTYRHVSADIRDKAALEEVFRQFAPRIALIIHTAAQPSHDWAARDPLADFTINANGTLNLLELCRSYCAEAPFIFTSTNKVYGDRPNFLPLVEEERRWELGREHPFAEHGIDETMSIDQSMHSLFGASKVSADILVQEYGRYFGMKTACFRGGCLTGPAHSGTQLHGFLAYLMKCAATCTPYTVFGYEGKQVRDNIHSEDLVNAFWSFFQNPRSAEVYNIGGGRDCNCSMLEAIELCEAITGQRMNWQYSETNRAGDHIWWISDTRRFRSHYPEWSIRHDVGQILEEIHAANRLRWREAV
ncbi:NAD-dependent epimerase/dehydratase family protein [Aquamicrobium sp. LC103]|uniref:NAD-dependent epimerase/dehydratase family protein n=1 Tax=Aquamicrobium sp. LC103 TaxID=1120658 RepID=UPI00063EB455|nr:NAD-dependent epimerase/dehydratase family protein [Aquamicrobium sp. LC103]TKT77466.1 NAD-dependent epimerase/dehydratase family protein [Aquamicrobium sp. LC103]